MAPVMKVATTRSNIGTVLAFMRPPAFPSALCLGLFLLLFIKAHRPHNAFTFFNVNQLVGLHIFQRVDLSCWPANFQNLRLVRFAQAEVNAQVVLRDVAAAAANLVNLLMRLRFIRRTAKAAQPRSNTAAIRFRSDSAHLDPMVSR